MSSARHSVIWELTTRQLLLPKLDHELSECEDAIALDTESCRFAVADGATEAFDARNWAQRLAQRWVECQSVSTTDDFRDWVATEGRELQESWNGLSLAWYSEEKARAGSFAALVGVELDLKTEAPSWKAIALGDACLLHCRRGTLLKSLPLCHSESFNLAPVLVASDSAMHEASMKSVVIDSGNCESGDVLWLLSDGVASWYLERFEKNEFAYSDFFETKRDDEVRSFFDEERLAGRMRNDDVAAIRIEIRRRS